MTSGTLTRDTAAGFRPRGPRKRLSLYQFLTRSGLQAVVVGTSKDPNAKVTVLLVSPAEARPVLAVKVPTTARAEVAVEAEARLLLELGKLQRPVVREAIPRLLDVVEGDGRVAIVMTALAGVPMSASYLAWRHTARQRHVARDFAAVAHWLAAFQAETAGEEAPISVVEVVSSALAERFRDDEQLPGDLELLAEIDDRLRVEATPRTAVHGDFWFGNVLLHGGRVSGVVDWEAGASSGEPVRDLARFANMYALYLDRHTKPGRRVTGHRGLRAERFGAALAYAIAGTGWFPELFRSFLGDGLARLGASPARWRDVALAGVAEVAATTDDPAFARRHLDLFRRLAPGGKEAL